MPSYDLLHLSEGQGLETVFWVAFTMFHFYIGLCNSGNSVCLPVCISSIHAWTVEVKPTNPYIYIYLESVSPRKHFKYIYMATPLSVLQKKKRKWNFFQKKECSYRPKNRYAYNLTLGVTWGGFQNLAIPLPLCIRLKCQKWFKKKQNT